MFYSIIIIAVIINGIISHLVGNNGKNRKIGYDTSFLVSFFFSPIIGLLLVLSSKNLSDEEIKLIEAKELEKKNNTSKLSNVLFYSFLIIIFLIIGILLVNQ